MDNIIDTLMRVGMLFILLILVYRFGDWKNWRHYSPTIIFIMVINLVASYLMYDHSLWYFRKSTFFPNDTSLDLWLAFVNFPLITLLYLSRYPYQSSGVRQFAYITLWGISFSLIEGLFKLMKGVSYHNHWNFWWSVLVWFIMFPVFTLYHTERRLWAWLICFGFAAFVIFYFGIPITRMK